MWSHGKDHQPLSGDTHPHPHDLCLERHKIWLNPFDNSTQKHGSISLNSSLWLLFKSPPLTIVGDAALSTQTIPCSANTNINYTGRTWTFYRYALQESTSAISREHVKLGKQLQPRHFSQINAEKPCFFCGVLIFKKVGSGLCTAIKKPS